MRAHLTSREAEFDALFKEIDADNSGKVDMEEFVALMAKMRKPLPQTDAAMLHLTDVEKERFKMIFKTFDIGGGGTLSTHELHNLFEKLGYCIPLSHTNKMVQEVDMDGSGTVDFEEFLFLLVKLGAGTATKQRVIMRPGGTYEEGRQMKVPLDQLWDLGYDDISRFREAGWSAQELIEGEVAGLLDLRRNGFTASDLRKAGWKARDLKLAGYSMYDLRIAGFSAEALRRCTKGLLSQKILEDEAGFNQNGQRSQPLQAVPKSYGMFPDAADEGGSPAGGLLQVNMGLERPHTVDPNQRWWSTPRIRSLCDGPTHDMGMRRPVTAA
jgi:Ca2+-binding EF-hand superfamily protein